MAQIVNRSASRAIQNRAHVFRLLHRRSDVSMMQQAKHVPKNNFNVTVELKNRVLFHQETSVETIKMDKINFESYPRSEHKTH